MTPVAQTTTHSFFTVNAGALEIAIIIQGEVFWLYLYEWLSTNRYISLQHIKTLPPSTNKKHKMVQLWNRLPIKSTDHSGTW